MRNGKRYEKTKEVCKKLISIDKNNMDAYYLWEIAMKKLPIEKML